MNYLFIRLLNNTFVASVLIIAVIITRILIRKAPRWISCALWGLVAIRLVFPFSIESVLSLIPSAEPIPVDIEYQAVPQIESGVPVINHVANPVIESNFTPQVAVSVNPLQVVLFIAEIVWCVGIIALCVYAIISYIVLRKKVAVSQKVFDNVYVCDEVSSPFILGILRARIYLPSGMNSEARECVLEHEKAHLRRFDHLWKPVGFIILAVYWFNPLCWVAYVLLCKDIELACDEKVTKDKDKAWKATYCQALLDCKVNRRIITACPVAFGEVSAKDRIKSVLNYKKPSFWIIIAAIVICAVVAVCFMTSPKKAVDNVNNGNDIYLSGTEALDSASPEYKEIISLLEKQHEIEAYMETVIDWNERDDLKTWEDFEIYANQVYTLEYVNNCFTPKYFGEESSYYYNDDSGQLMRHEADGIVNDIQSNNIFRLTQSGNNYVVVQEVATDSEPTYNFYVITDTENGLRIDSRVDLHGQNLSEAIGIVNTETLKMRAEPFVDANVISLLKKDQKVNILADNGGFYAILVQTDGGALVGYVNKEFVNAGEGDYVSIENNNIYVDTEYNGNGIYIESRECPEEAVIFVQENFYRYIQDLPMQDDRYSDIDITHIELGSPFTIQKGSTDETDIYYFPIIYENEIKFTFRVYLDSNGTYTGIFSEYLASELNNLSNITSLDSPVLLILNNGNIWVSRNGELSIFFKAPTSKEEPNAPEGYLDEKTEVINIMEIIEYKE